MSPEFYAWMQEAPSDVRSQAVADYSVAPSGDPDYNTGYYPLKYPGNAGASVPAYTTNVKVFRLSEAVLIAAEAAYRTGADAASYVNMLRRNRIQGYEDVSSVSVNDILDERRKELFGEGQIAFDYWRNGLTVVKEGFSVGPQDGRTVLQIPKEEIDLAKGKLVQNPL